MTTDSIGEIAGPPRGPQLPEPPVTRTKVWTNARTPYGPDSPHSYFRDLAVVERAKSQSDSSVDRALRDGGIPAFGGGPIPSRLDGGLDEARKRLQIAGERRDLSSTAGAGGEFIPSAGPPVFVAEAFAIAARNRAAMARILPTRSLPEAGMKIETPRFTSGAAVAVHADNAAVQETDPVTALASAPVGQLAGQTDVSQQAVDRSNMDEAIAGELGAAYGERLDVQVLNGSGSAGQLLGLLNVTGITALTYTAASPTGPENFAQVGRLIASTATAYGGQTDTLLVHPRRAAFIRSKLGYAPEWPAEIEEVGAIPTNLGAGTNEDVVIALAREESPLFLQSPSFRAMADPLSANLETRFQVHGYAALLANRQPASIGKSIGTGWASPTF